MTHKHSSDMDNQIRRIAVWTNVDCPACGEVRGRKCIGQKGQPRSVSHAARWEAWRALLAGVVR